MPEQATLEGFEAAALRVGVTGAVRTAKLGTEVMKDFSKKYDTEKYLNRGYLSPDGVEVSFDEDTNEFIPWQEAVAIRRDITKSVKTVKITLWQFTKDNAAWYFGVPGGTIQVNDDGSWFFDEGNLPEFEHSQIIIDVVDGDKAMKLTLLDAQVTTRSGMVFRREDAIGLELELSSYPAGKEYEAQKLQGKTARWLFSSNWDGSGASGNTSGSTDGVQPLVVQTATLPAASENEEYTATLVATGGTTPYTWQLGASSTLPDGLQLSSEGKITGTPTTTGSTEITVEVLDSKGLKATKGLTLTVN